MKKIPYPIRYTQSAFEDYIKLIYKVNFQEFYKWKTQKNKKQKKAKSIPKDQFIITFTHYYYPNNTEDKIVYEIPFDELATIDPTTYLEETKRLYAAIDKENVQ